MMGPTTGIVLFLIIWSVAFLAAIPIRLQTQDEAGKVVPGTHKGSPERHNLKKKAWIATLVAFVIWAVVAWVIMTGQLTLDDIDLYRRFGPGPFNPEG